METYIIFILCVASFFAGFVDAIVGGGGLIQTPIAMIMLPGLSVATVVGTLKVPAFSGTSFAAYQYLKKVTMNWGLLIIMAVVSFIFAYLGSNLLKVVSSDFMKPLLFVVLIAIAIYTFKKKDFGSHKIKDLSKKRLMMNLYFSQKQSNVFHPSENDKENRLELLNLNQIKSCFFVNWSIRHHL